MIPLRARRGRRALPRPARRRRRRERDHRRAGRLAPRSSPATCSSPSARGRRLRRRRARRAAPPRRSSRTTPFAALAALGGARPRPQRARGSSASPARPARRRRRTSSPRSARRGRARSPPRRASTTRSACRSRSAASSPTPRSASSSWRCAASARSPSSARIARPRRRRDHDVGPAHLELRRLARGRRAGEGRAGRGAAAGRHGDRPGRVSRSSATTSTVVRARRAATSRVEDGRTLIRSDGRRDRSTSPRGTRRRTRSPRSHALDALGLRSREDAVDVEFSRWRGEELPLPGRRPADQRRLQREPASRCAPRSSTSSTRAGGRRTRRGPRRHGRARPRRAALPRGDRRAGAAISASTSLIGVGELARGYVDGGVPVTRWCADAERRPPTCAELVQPGDCVLVKGSRAVGLERVAEALAAVNA